MKPNSTIRQESLSKLKGHWWAGVLASFIFILIAEACNSPYSIHHTIAPNPSYWLLGGCSILSLFIVAPLAVGFFNSYRKFYVEGDNGITGNMFNIGFSNYWHNLGGYLLMSLFLLFWTLLLIVPGIIMSMAYFCVPYLLVEEPGLTPMEAIRKSKEMMKGHKMDLFLMQLGFLGFALLCIFTLGIGFLWLIPYIYNTSAGFFEEVKANAK